MKKGHEQYHRMLKELQELILKYRQIPKQKKFRTHQILLFWKIGDLLFKNNLTDKDFWEIQNKKIGISRTSLQRAFWLRKVFSLEEVKKIPATFTLSTLIKFLPHLAKGTKAQLSLEDISRAKKAILEGKTPDFIKLKKKRSGKKEIGNLKKKELQKLMNDFTSWDFQIVSFKEKLSEKEYKDFGRVFFKLLGGREVPTEKEIGLLKELHLKSSKFGYTELSDFFNILISACELTSIDSRRVIKMIFDISLLRPFYLKMFTGTTL